MVKQNGELTALLAKLNFAQKLLPKQTSTAKEDKKTEGATQDGKRGGNDRRCKIYGAFHPTKYCWELEANKDKRPANWKGCTE